MNNFENEVDSNFNENSHINADESNLPDNCTMQNNIADNSVPSGDFQTLAEQQEEKHDKRQPVRPQSPVVNFDNIPGSLQQMSQWLLWRYEQNKDDKWTKVPYQHNGFKASVTNPEHFSSFQDVCIAYKGGNFDGIGFVLTASENFVAVDLDYVIDICVENSTSRSLSGDAKEIVLSFGSYAEKSPSGAGVRIFATGKLPPQGRKRGPFEIYEKDRFVTVTGHQLEGTPCTVNEASQAILTFHAKYISPKHNGASNKGMGSAVGTHGILPDMSVPHFSEDELLQLITEGSFGEKLASVFAGDSSQHGGDVSAGDLGCCSYLARITRANPSLIDSLFRRSGRIRSKWDERHRSDGATYGQITIEKAIESYREQGLCLNPCFPQWPSAKIPESKHDLGSAKSFYGFQQVLHLLYPGWTVAALNTQVAFADRIREQLGDDLKHCPQLGWMIFNGKSWDADDPKSTRTSALVAKLSRCIRAEASHLYSLVSVLTTAGRDKDAEAMSQAAKEHTRHARQVEERKFIEGALHFAAGNTALRISHDAFDQKPWVVGFQNGVWDHGEFRTHRREDYVLHLSPVDYNPQSDQREWEMVLDRIVGGLNTASGQDLERTLQDIAGYILSGASHLRQIPWLYGSKGTGKSTFAELLLTVLGKNAATVDPKKLRSNSMRERLNATLWNRRLAVCNEAGSQQIEAELLKTLSGGDTLPVRFLFKESFDAHPHHVLLMVSNDPPRLDAYDDALKDRVITLPFVNRLDSGGTLTFTGSSRVEAVRKEVSSNLVRGFAAWAVEGMLRVRQTQKIHRADIVEQATTQFWDDTDPLSEFWETIPIQDLIGGITKADMRHRYQMWCYHEGINPYSLIGFARACRSRGLDEARRGKENTRLWKLSPKSPLYSRATTSSNVNNSTLSEEAGTEEVENEPSEEQETQLSLLGTPMCGDDSNSSPRPYHWPHAIGPYQAKDYDDFIGSDGEKKVSDAGELSVEGSKTEASKTEEVEDPQEDKGLGDTSTNQNL